MADITISLRNRDRKLKLMTAMFECSVSYQGLTQGLGALLDWAEELLKSTSKR